MLKVAFPVDIHSEKATYEIQYGNVERPTHWNTSWDYARFEVCGHKWADLSEDDYGVSLLNDCKYGYDIKDGVIRLSLLKSAVYPNKNADNEIHEFTYSLYPHAGGWRCGKTIQMAYSLNCPYTVVWSRPIAAFCLPRCQWLISTGKISSWRWLRKQRTAMTLLSGYTNVITEEQKQSCAFSRNYPKYGSVT